MAPVPWLRMVPLRERLLALGYRVVPLDLPSFSFATRLESGWILSPTYLSPTLPLPASLSMKTSHTRLRNVARQGSYGSSNFNTTVPVSGGSSLPGGGLQPILVQEAGECDLFSNGECAQVMSRFSQSQLPVFSRVAFDDGCDSRCGEFNIPGRTRREGS